MATKSNKKTKDNKNLIIGICAAVALIVVIIITVLVVNNQSLNDDYFVSDGSKYVFTLETDEKDIEEGDEITPLKTHFVYTYEGDKVTGMKTYYVYADANAAKTAFDKMKEAGGEEAQNFELSGKYIIITADEEEYKNRSASDIKKDIEFMESLKNMDSSDFEDVEETEDEAVEEDSEEVEE